MNDELKQQIIDDILALVEMGLVSPDMRPDGKTGWGITDEGRNITPDKDQSAAIRAQGKKKRNQ